MRYTVLLPVPQAEDPEGVVALGAALAGTRGGRLLLLSVVAVDPGQPISDATVPVQERRQAVEALVRHIETACEARAMVKAAHEVWPEIVRTAADEEVDLLLLGWKGYTTTPGQLFGTTIDAVLDHPPCDVAVAASIDPQTLRRILVPVRGGPYAGLALQVATDLAAAAGATVTILHVLTGGAQEAGVPVRRLLDRYGRHERVRAQMTVRGDVTPTILQEAATHDLIVMGVGGAGERPPFGLVPSAIMEQARCGMIAVRTRAAATVPTVPAEPTWPSAVVDKWFAENTFHAGEFDDLQRLLALKKRRGVTISLGLPALNEEDTIGPIITTLRAALMDRVPLLDEIVVIDSGSADRTVEIARALGIPVTLHPEVLPQYGSHRGKGEALWKSLYVLRGDLVVWADTDIRNMHPKFIYGVIGPLLASPRLVYVKGYYRRPLQIGDHTYETGGGRVTELVARPLLNLFFPELSGFIQPLAGEYAGWRTALEQLPFFTGYGVETGLLIDCLERFGLDAMGQVDLERRIHRNQALEALSKMSFAIIQIALRRLRDQGRLQLATDFSESLKLIRVEAGRLALDVQEIREAERPPMITLPEYRMRRVEAGAR